MLLEGATWILGMVPTIAVVCCQPLPAASRCWWFKPFIILPLGGEIISQLAILAFDTHLAFTVQLTRGDRLRLLCISVGTALVVCTFAAITVAFRSSSSRYGYLYLGQILVYVVVFVFVGSLRQSFRSIIRRLQKVSHVRQSVDQSDNFSLGGRTLNSRSGGDLSAALTASYPALPPPTHSTSMGPLKT